MTARKPAAHLTDQERADKFGEYLSELVETLKAERDWTTSQVIKQGGAGRTTFYRWINANLADGMPKARAVRDFHRRLDLDPEHALQILGYSSARTTSLPPDVVRITDPRVREYVREIVRAVESDTLSTEEKYHVRATLAQLAGKRTPPLPSSSSSGEPAGT